MKLQAALGLLALVVARATAQSTEECTRELARTDDCAAVINPNACYNMYRFRTGMQTLTCIEGADDAERKRRACKCCTCVGPQLCEWARTSRICQAGGATAPVGKGKGKKKRAIRGATY